MASEPATETKTASKLKLDPPEALQPITVHEAAGLVPLRRPARRTASSTDR